MIGSLKHITCFLFTSYIGLLLWMVAKSCTTNRMVESPTKYSGTTEFLRLPVLLLSICDLLDGTVPTAPETCIHILWNGYVYIYICMLCIYIYIIYICLYIYTLSVYMYIYCVLDFLEYIYIYICILFMYVYIYICMYIHMYTYRHYNRLQMEIGIVLAISKFMGRQIMGSIMEYDGTSPVWNLGIPRSKAWIETYGDLGIPLFKTPPHMK